MHLGAIATYPVKSCHRLEHERADVRLWGLAGDRRWLITDEQGRMLTQREEPRLTQIRPVLAEGALVLRHEGAGELTVPAEPGDLDPVKVWRTTVDLSRAGDEADVWLSTVLERKVRLYYLDDPTRRPVNPEYANPDDRVSLADGYPLLLANTASLAAVNDWLAEECPAEWPLPMTRFRPNVVVEGAPAWAEDGWLGRRIRIGSVTFRAPKPCDRCVITTTDQETGARGREPLRTLARHRNVDQGLLFGLNLIPDGTGEIRVGDQVTVLD
ncbi:MOSC domain-containing protein [Rugosimonospora africana]|uniref:Molybdenum cofactor biosysynthesis protein n=1 Tax=Rugosimonospora africana TaxID=556532 RepID=A0A8J3QKZ4_9ACTN|nr:MOSC N-terminal beta barrel domain-containing protein [Rugosimonospora africana]GIH12900.1 molybdenum cofactor biosysynthesis protein [Rugosimonospora africana]